MNTQTNFAPHDILENSTVPTLREAYENYISDRRDLRDGSVIVYNQAIKRAGHLLDIPINELHFSDFKHQYAHLRYDIGYKPASIELLNSLIVPTLNLAVQDDILAKNPAAGAYHEVARGDAWKMNHKNALSEETQAEFLNHVHNSRFRNWENFFILLFGTGLRIGEAIGLKWEDLDFSSKTIHMQRSISFRNKTVVEGPPKSNSGKRTIPMLPSVMEALLRELQLSKLTKISIDIRCIPGEKGYIFLNFFLAPTVVHHWETNFHFAHHGCPHEAL